MKILHIAQFLGIGGLEKVLHLLIQQQIQNGLQVQLIVYDYEQTWVEKFRADGIIVHTNYQKKDGYDFNLIKYFSTKVFDFDIVHTHDLNPMMYIGPLKMFSKLKNKPFPQVIHTTHGMEHVDISPKTRVYEKLISLMADRIVGVSPSICNYYTKTLKVNSKKVFNIDNGTHVLEKIPESVEVAVRDKICQLFNLDGNRKIWVYIARVVPLKDQRILIEAFKQFPDEQLLLIGPSGNKTYWDDLQINLPSNVRMPGGAENIQEILAAANFFISASHHEGIPIAVLEAGAAGVPCLLSDIPGHRSFIRNLDKPTVSFFPKGDLEILISKIQELSNNTEFAKNLRCNLHQLIYKEFSAKRMSNKYLNIYKGKLC